MDELFTWCVNHMAGVWGMLWIIIITGISVGGVIWVCQWVMRLVGVM